MNTVTLQNAVDAYTDQAVPAKNIPGTTRLHLVDSTNDKYAWLYFTLPFPLGSTIALAELRLWSQTSTAVSVTLTGRLAASKWSLHRLRWDNQPAVTGPTATLVKAATAANQLWTLDVTTLMSAVAGGTPWYGIRISQSTATLLKFHASEAQDGDMRPTLYIEWVEPSEEPENLRPGDGLVVSKQKTFFLYDYVDPGGQDQVSQQIQTFASEANAIAGTSILFDTGEIAATSGEYDSSTGAWAGLADAASVWWKVRARDNGGQWTPWSDPVTFTRRTYGTLTITSPTGGQFFEGAPTITWTFTGRTQTAYRIIVARAAALHDVVYDTGWVPGTALTHQVPFGRVKYGVTYRVTLMVQDEYEREALPGDPGYVVATADAIVAHDGAVTGITALAVSSSALLPIATLTFTRASGQPNGGFQLLRSLDGGATYEYVADYEAADVFVSGTSYQIIDSSPPPYQNITWMVTTIVNGRQSTGSTVAGSVRRLAPFLYRKDGVDAVCLINPQRSMGFSDVHGVHEPLGGASVVVTQRLGKMKGSCAGRLVDDAFPGSVTAAQQLTRFLSMRSQVGEVLYLAIANKTFKVNAYNFAYDILTDASGITYQVSFDWVEVG